MVAVYLTTYLLEEAFLIYCVSALVAMVAISWHQILVFRSKFIQNYLQRLRKYVCRRILLPRAPQSAVGTQIRTVYPVMYRSYLVVKRAARYCGPRDYRTQFIVVAQTTNELLNKKKIRNASSGK